MSEKFSLSEYQSAYRKVIKNEKGFGFMAHLVIYIFINAVLIGYNLLSNPGFHWFYFPLLGWGLGLIMQYVLEIFYLQKDMERKEALAEKRAREQKLSSRVESSEERESEEG